MRPSLVRSNIAPQASSSFTRAGASRACSSAMRQLFRYCPPRIVSAKWTRQLSRSSTLPMAAAMPPSAITVWALPSNDFVTTPTFTPAAEASIAARSPAPPAPTTSTSNSWASYSAMLENSPVVPDPHRAQPHVQVRKADIEHAEPGPQHVAAIQARDAIVGRFPRRRFRHRVELTAHQVPQRVAPEGIQTEQNRVCDQHQTAHADAKAIGAIRPGKPERSHTVISQDAHEQDRQVQKVAMHILQNQRKGDLAPVG